MTSINAGYRMGAVQAMDTIMNLGVVWKYKWVIHLHPDIFIVYPRHLEETLTSTSKSVVTGLFPLPGSTRCFTFNFFAFKPSQISVEAFSEWKDWEGLPECY